MYLDNSATTKPSAAAVEAVNRALEECFGNPSSGHRLGRAAAELLKNSREKVASALGAKPEELFFTSGGTEADNWAVICGAKHNSRVGKHVLTTAVEHDAVLKAMKQLEASGFEVEYLKPDASGNIPVERFEAAIREDTALVSVMMVNNETGCVFPIEAIARAIKAKRSRALLHTDAVQGFLKLPLKAKTLGADLISISSHKVHGPKGCGALYIKSGLHLPPYIFGGGQENAYRSGTEAMPAIAGFAAAADEGALSFDTDTEYMYGLKATLKEQLSEDLPDIVFIGDGAAPHILSISLPGYRSEVIMNYLDAKGICVSKGSACKKGKRSHVLEAMGLPNDVMDGSLRISLSQYNTAAELRELVRALKNAKSELYPSL